MSVSPNPSQSPKTSAAPNAQPSRFIFGMVQGSEFKLQGSGFKVEALSFWVQGLGFKVQGLD